MPVRTSLRRPARGLRRPAASIRVARIRERIRALGLDALLVSSPANIRYLCGFSGSNALLAVTGTGGLFLTDSRYILQSREEVRNFSRRITARGLAEELAADHIRKSWRRVGVEAEAVTYAAFRQIRSLFKGVAIVATAGLVEELALIKGSEEVALLEEAARVADRVFAAVVPFLRPGRTELEIAAEISRLTVKNGGEGDAFDVIVASGPRGALPHARPSGRRMIAGDFVVLDFGARVGGYSSDITRTVALRRASRKLREAYEAVRVAQAEAIAAARGGMTARDLDSVARKRIAAAGFGRYFVHSLGHGLGLRIHERPRVSNLSSEVLESGSVITIEPGVYLPGIGGVRIEDDVLLGDRGCRLLTSSPRELLIV
jgi:Xaa-Pro aminopeptidase